MARLIEHPYRLDVDLVEEPSDPTSLTIAMPRWSHWRIAWSDEGFNGRVVRGVIHVHPNEAGLITGDPLGALLRGELTHR